MYMRFASSGFVTILAKLWSPNYLESKKLFDEIILQKTKLIHGRFLDLISIWKYVVICWPLFRFEMTALRCLLFSIRFVLLLFFLMRWWNMWLRAAFYMVFSESAQIIRNPKHFWKIEIIKINQNIFLICWLVIWPAIGKWTWGSFRPKTPILARLLDEMTSFRYSKMPPFRHPKMASF